MSKFLNLSAALLTLASGAAAQDTAPSQDGGYGLGRPALPEEVAAWNTDVRPDGTGLPTGSGDVLTGEEIYVENCAVCHGDFGEAVGRWPALAGGEGTLENKDPVKTVGSYWPYLSTVYDYIHRAMPFGHAKSLDADQTYALTAYILYLNDLVDGDFTLSDENFTDISMPNEGNFIMDDRIETELPLFQAEACMEDCKDSVEITMHASVLDVTPKETSANVEVTQSDAGASADVSAAVDPALIAAGEKAFRQCKACHMVGEGAKNRVGPELNDVVGRTIGTVPGFKYSAPLQDAMAAGEVWDTDRLHTFLANPRDAMPGTRMSFRGVPDPAEVDALIAYLQGASQ